MKKPKPTILFIISLFLISILNPFTSSAQTDIGIISIQQPGDSTVYGSQITTKCVIKNFGQTTISSTYCLLYIDTVLYINENFTLSTPLAPDSSVELTFLNTYLAPKKDYILKIVNSTAMDTSIANNTLTKQIYNKQAALDLKCFNLVVTPSNGDTTCINVNLSVSFDYTNFGTDTVSNLILYYNVNAIVHGGEVDSNILLPGDTNSYTFTSTYLSITGYYHLKVFLPHVGDAFPADNVIALAYFGINCPTAINNSLNEVKQITIYPNPATSQLYLEIGDFTAKESGALSIFNSLGQEVEQLEISKTAKTITLNIEDYPKGIYYIQMQTKDNIVATGKFIKE